MAGSRQPLQPSALLASGVLQREVAGGNVHDFPGVGQRALEPVEPACSSSLSGEPSRSFPVTRVRGDFLGRVMDRSDAFLSLLVFPGLRRSSERASVEMVVGQRVECHFSSKAVRRRW